MQSYNCKHYAAFVTLLIASIVYCVKEEFPMKENEDFTFKKTDEIISVTASPQAAAENDMRKRAKEDLELQRKLRDAVNPKPKEKKSEEEELRQQKEDEYKLQLLTTQLDRNGDKVITMEELSTWTYQGIRHRGTLNEESLAKLKGIFEAADNNPKDGLVSWREVVKGKHRYNLEDIELFRMDVENGLNISFVEEAVETIDDDHKRFKAADENGDELLNMQEMAAFLHPYDYKRMHELELDRVIKEHDTDKNSVIDLFEFYNDKEGKKTEKELKELERQFLIYDVNKDDSLDRSEVRAWVLPNTMEVARREAHFLMVAADKDKDGELTYRELLDNHEFWAGSTSRQDGTKHYKDEL